MKVKRRANFNPVFKQSGSENDGTQKWFSVSSPANSKSTNMLLAIRSTTKMKRSNHHQTKNNNNLQQGFAFFASENLNKECANCKSCACKLKSCCKNEDSEDEHDAVDSPRFVNFNFVSAPKKVSLKTIGVSIANIFKPNVKKVKHAELLFYITPKILPKLN